MPRKIKPKKCKNCKLDYLPKLPLQQVCSAFCGYEYARKLKDRKEKKDWSEQKKNIKEKLMDVPEYKKILQVKINTIIRLIDRGQKCMSCNSIATVAGHYHSVGANPALRFNLHNIHGQEISCNGEKGGNISKYAIGLLNTYGREYSDYVIYDLPKKYETLKPTVPELKEWIYTANEIIKELKHVNYIYSKDDRIRLRNEFNDRLKIY